ncbi:MAG: hypothetical protein QM768_11435 [Agriterribacter sp.]
MEKLLFIPSDSIRNEMSRSYYFARYLSEYYQVFQLRWHDTQSLSFENKKKSKLNTLIYWFKALSTSVRFQNHPTDRHCWIWIPYMSHMVIYRFIGFTLGTKLSRKFNKIILSKVIKKIKPDIIFYADGFDKFPYVDTSALVISDVQDDIDETNFSYTSYHKEYGRRQFNLTIKNYIVSRAAGERLGKYYQAEFNYLPNGADFKSMQNIDLGKLTELKESLDLADKYVITFIGGDVWFDAALAEDLFNLANNDINNIHFVIVGNVPVTKKLPNVTFIGAVSNKDSYYYYHLSNMGILLKSSENSPFLYNSMPLKIVQYSCVNKIFISPPVAWLEEERYTNVLIVENFSAGNLWSAIKYLKENEPPIDNRWKDYDWKKIVERIHSDLKNID